MADGVEGGREVVDGRDFFWVADGKVMDAALRNIARALIRAAPRYGTTGPPVDGVRVPLQSAPLAPAPPPPPAAEVLPIEASSRFDDRIFENEDTKEHAKRGQILCR